MSRELSEKIEISKEYRCGDGAWLALALYRRMPAIMLSPQGWGVLAVVRSRVEKAQSFSFLPVFQFCQDAGYLSTAPLVPRANPLY